MSAGDYTLILSSEIIEGPRARGHVWRVETQSVAHEQEPNDDPSAPLQRYLHPVTGSIESAQAVDHFELIFPSQASLVLSVDDGTRRCMQTPAPDVTIDAAFKPIKRGRQHGFWESYQAEIGAYEMDKLLGLGMVPPTVERRGKKNKGSLQFWVHNCQLYRDVMASTPQTPSWSHQLSRMKMLDILINNDDRNAQNFLVDPDAHIILIDHSRAFVSSKKILKNEKKLPNQYDRALVEKLRTLDRETLDALEGNPHGRADQGDPGAPGLPPFPRRQTRRRER